MRKGLLIVSLALAGIWGAMWLFGHLVFFVVRETREVPETREETVEGVDVYVWANPVEVERTRSLRCPLVVHLSQRGPFVLGLRFVDPERVAVAVMIHSASLRVGNDSPVVIRLGAGRKSPGSAWLPFFMNASEYIVHVFHSEPVRLDDPAVLEADVSLKGPRGVVRRRLSLPVVVQASRRSCWSGLSH
ncbi:MAG: hypothetical protein MUE73_18175 [Planctomycetes bacterium]|nr:hypothetical protein [Planctomycetota bacterium]